MFKILSVKSSYGPTNVLNEDVNDILKTNFLCKTQKEKKLIDENIDDSIIDNSNISYYNGVNNNTIRIFEESCRQHNKNRMRANDVESRIDIRSKSRHGKATKTIIPIEPSTKNIFPKKKGRIG
jgi:hypothetical protein